jgi:hypothetical protein
MGSEAYKAKIQASKDRLKTKYGSPEFAVKQQAAKIRIADKLGRTKTKEQINRLVKRSNIKSNTSLSVRNRDPIPSSRAIGKASGGSQGGSIASPLVEVLDDREYGTIRTLTSSNGLFVMVYRNVTKRVFNDANGNLVEIEYSDDDAP